MARSASGPRRTEAAKDLCAQCDVRIECLEAALAQREPAGIWGGLAPDERRRLSGGAPKHEIGAARGESC